MSYDIWRVGLDRSASLRLVALAGCGGFSADPTAQGGVQERLPPLQAPLGRAAPAPWRDGQRRLSGSGGSGAPAPPGPPEPTCTDVVACGGDVAGVWFARARACTERMADISKFGLSCTDVAATGKSSDGNWTLGADGKISDNTTTTGMVELELPKECLNVSGTFTTCDRVPRQLSSLA